MEEQESKLAKDLMDDVAERVENFEKKIQAMKEQQQTNCMQIPIDDILIETIEEFDEEAVLEMAETIKSFGLLNPIPVRQDAGGKYHLVAGQRRLIAAKRTGLQEVGIEVVRE